MAQYVNQSETVTHGINAPVVNYGQIQVSKNLLDKPSVPDTDVGGRWTSGIPGAVSSFGQGLLSGMKANAAAEKANKEEQQEKVNNQLALQARRYTEKFIQGGYNGNLVSYENDMRTLGDSYIPLLGSERTNKTLNDNSSGLLSLSETGRKQTLTNTIAAHNAMRQKLKETYAGLTYASNDTLDGIIYNFQGRKDTARAAQENFSMNPNNVAAKNYAINALTEDAAGQLAFWANNLDHRVTEAELANETLEMQRKYKQLGYNENNIYAAIAAASETYRVDASQDSDWLKLSVDEQKKVTDLMLSSEKNKVLLSSPSFRRAYSVLGDKIVDLAAVYSQESDNVSQFLDTAAGEALTAITGNKELTPEQKKELSQNSLGLSMITKMSREIATNGGGINSKNKANTVKNTVEVNNDNNASADLWKKDGNDSLVVIANYRQQDIEGIRKEAERLSKSSDPDEAQSGRDLLLATATAGAQYKAALIMSPKEAQANGFEKFKYNSVARERLRYDPYTGEFWLAKPTGVIESLGEGIDKIGNLYSTYLKSMDKALDAQSQDLMEKREIVDWMDIEILPKNDITQPTEEEAEEPNLTSEETYTESREMNKDLFTPVTATASVSSSSVVGGASVDYSQYSIGEDLDNAIKADERVAAEMGEYDTNLGAGGEAAFSNWRQRLPENLQSTDDYDLRGFYKKYGDVSIEEGQHLTDEFKKPNHPTFSKESKYYKKGMWAGKWDEDDNFIIPLITPKERLQELIQYWKNSDERGVILVDNPKVEKELAKTEKKISRYTEQLNDKQESEDTKRLIRQELKRLNMKRNSLERQIVVDTYNE